MKKSKKNKKKKKKTKQANNLKSVLNQVVRALIGCFQYFMHDLTHRQSIYFILLTHSANMHFSY